MCKENVKSLGYIAQGCLLLNLWGGGQGTYPSRKIEGDTLEQVEQEIKQGIEDGSLDSGMGCESIEGAYIQIDHQQSIEIDGDTFHNIKNVETEMYGDLSEEQQDFLIESFLSFLRSRLWKLKKQEQDENVIIA